MERFNFWMTTKDSRFMLVQHLVASLSIAGRLAVGMPPGVLFRGGDEKNSVRLVSGAIWKRLLVCHLHFFSVPELEPVFW
jgi:hypothetical protein